MTLKPCPFCGSKNIILISSHNKTWNYATCDDCNSDGPMADTPEDAKKKWNNRK